MSLKDQFEFFCLAIRDFGVKNVILMQDGHVLFRKDYEPDERRNQYSVTKSFTGTAAGIAVSEGLLKMDDPALRYLEEDIPDGIDPHFRDLTIRHLLTMQAGFSQPYLMSGPKRKQMADEGITDWVRYLLTCPMEDRPGYYFLYSNAGPYLLGVILEKVTGQSLTDYLMPRLFGPLGIARPEWETDPMGRTFGSSGLVLSPSELARFGQMYLQGGAWEGRQIVPADWVSLVRRTSIVAGDTSMYSLLFWKGKHNSFSAVGRYGQYCTVLPDKRAVLVINSFDESDENLLEYFWTYLYDAL